MVLHKRCSNWIRAREDLKNDALHVPITQETEAQRGKVTCLMSPSWSMKISAQVVWFQDPQSSCRRLASCSSFDRRENAAGSGEELAKVYQ